MLPAPSALRLELEEPGQIFSLRQAIDYGVRNNPRLRAALAAIERTQGQEQVAFAPFLPQLDFLTHYGVTSQALGPASAGSSGIILPSGEGMHTYAQAEVQLQWTLFDFGRRTGLYGQAVAREQIASLQAGRAEQTVAFDVANAYLQALQAKADLLIQEEAIRSAESTLKDTRSRRAAGVADKDDVLRCDVQLAEAQDALDIAEERELAALAKLNNAMGRRADIALQLIDNNQAAPFQVTLKECLEAAASQRREIGVARQAIAGAQSGRQAATAEFLPRVYALGSVGVIGGQNIIDGVQQGAGLHIDVPLYSGGRHRGNLHSADAEISEAVANAQVIVDDVSLQVTLAYRSVTTAQKRVEHLRPAVIEARENLRLVGNKYRNGTATPTDIVDAETTLTRAQQQLSAATTEYLAARARLDYALGNPQGSWF
jgi:outer membrane protein